MGLDLITAKPDAETQHAHWEVTGNSEGHCCRTGWDTAAALQKCFAATFPGKTRDFDTDTGFFDVLDFTPDETVAMAEQMQPRHKPKPRTHTKAFCTTCAIQAACWLRGTIRRHSSHSMRTNAANCQICRFNAAIWNACGKSRQRPKPA